MPARRLTDEQIERIVEMRERGLSFDRIGAAIGCSGKAVSWHCLKLGAEPPKPPPIKTRIVGPQSYARRGFTVRRFTPEEDARLLELEAQGLSATEIGRAIGRRWNSVTGRLMTLARHDARAEAGR